MKIVKFLGGLGNQMFQYAFYLSLAKRYSNIKADVSGFDDYLLHNGLELENIFNIKLDKANPLIVKIFNPKYSAWKYRKLRRILNLKKAFYNEKKFFIFDEEALINSKSRMYWGYWQNENYFKHITEEVRSSFIFKYPLESENLKISKLILNSESVSIHVRRGDYVGHSLLGGICDLNYYNEAISIIQKRTINPLFFIFSNDIDWCKTNLNLKNAHYISWNENEKSYIDMQLMSICKHNIIANSSFSWWGAWLNDNQDKIVISPKKWINSSSDSPAIEEWIKC